ncbi:Nitrilotriacetate monooxygenase component B [hydrothermal vent metagenome]|uniref:Nitrilotriacetate monooxygenase component B n=1 Tax=hydrothermal vent metagenome TaxID=652676 RepID=A0A1W1C2Z1_9ZZZZ
MIFNLNEDSKVNETYKLMAQTIIPRPIAWVVTEDNGVVNIAPFSYFIGLSSEPASVLISVGHKSDGTPKDTLANIRKNQKCTICMVQESDLEKMHFSSKELDKDLSEAQLFNIETETICNDYPPMIKGVPSAYFCDFNQEIDLGGGSTIPLVLNVQEIYIDDNAITDKERVSINFDPVARIGKSYAFLGEEISAPTIP